MENGEFSLSRGDKPTWTQIRISGAKVRYNEVVMTVMLPIQMPYVCVLWNYALYTVKLASVLGPFVLFDSLVRRLGCIFLKTWISVWTTKIVYPRNRHAGIREVSHSPTLPHKRKARVERVIGNSKHPIQFTEEYISTSPITSFHVIVWRLPSSCTPFLPPRLIIG